MADRFRPVVLSEREHVVDVAAVLESWAVVVNQGVLVAFAALGGYVLIPGRALRAVGLAAGQALPGERDDRRIADVVRFGLKLSQRLLLSDYGQLRDCCVILGYEVPGGVQEFGLAQFFLGDSKSAVCIV